MNEQSIDMDEEITGEEARHARPFAIEAIRALGVQLSENDRDDWILTLTAAIAHGSRCVDCPKCENEREKTDAVDALAYSLKGQIRGLRSEVEKLTAERDGWATGTDKILRALMGSNPTRPVALEDLAKLEEYAHGRALKIATQDAEIARLTREKSDAYEREAKTREQRNEQIAEVDRLTAELSSVRRERDAYKRAKEENDERFMRERDEARAEVTRHEDAITVLLRDFTVLSKDRDDARAIVARYAGTRAPSSVAVTDCEKAAEEIMSSAVYRLDCERILRKHTRSVTVDEVQRVISEAVSDDQPASREDCEDAARAVLSLIGGERGKPECDHRLIVRDGVEFCWLCGVPTKTPAASPPPGGARDALGDNDSWTAPSKKDAP